MMISHKKFKRNKKYRKKLIRITVDAFMVNFCIFGFFNSFVLNNYFHKKASDKEVVVKKTSKGFKIIKKDGAYYVDNVLIVNKTFPLDSTFYPTNTYETISSDTNFCSECLDKDAYFAYQEMIKAAKESDPSLDIWIQSGYRSYNYQMNVYNQYVSKDGKEAADTYSSRPGHSEHQTGLAFDLNSVTDDFTYTKEGIWINENCYKFGFIIRFPQNKEDKTGYKYESWHLRYVGRNLAEKLYNNGDWISLEEYFGVSSKYDS